MGMKTHDTMGRLIHRIPIYERIMEKTKWQGECLVYTGCRNPKGYGRVSNGQGGILVHRAIWEHHNGPTLNRVLHECDNPPCVRIEHLWEGTNADNSADMVQKGRESHASRGEGSGRVKLTTAAVKTIHELHARGVTSSEIAQTFHVHPAHISRIISGKRRRWG